MGEGRCYTLEILKAGKGGKGFWKQTQRGRNEAKKKGGKEAAPS